MLIKFTLENYKYSFKKKKKVLMTLESLILKGKIVLGLKHAGTECRYVFSNVLFLPGVLALPLYPPPLRPASKQPLGKHNLRIFWE